VKKIPWFLMFVFVFYLIGCSHSFKSETAVVSGKIVSFGQKEIEPKVAVQVVTWDMPTESAMIIQGFPYCASFKGIAWNFIGKTIPDLFIDKYVKITYKTIDTKAGLFYLISVEQTSPISQ
jgi:hypothetical protein